MQNFGRFAALAAFTFFAFAMQSFTTITAPQPPFIVIPASTPVSLEAQQGITSEDVEVGHQIDFVVRANVTINGTVVIAAGSIASGEVTQVTKAEKACETCQVGCAALQIVVKTVQAVDGSDVRLRSTPINIKAPRPNCPAQLQIGKTVSSTVLNNTKINL